MTLPQAGADELGAYVAQLVQGKTIAAGAETDLGARVYRGRRNIADEMMPCSVVIEGSQSLDEKAPGRSTRYSLRLPFALHAYVRCNPDDPNVAGHAALRDLKRAIFADPTMGGRVKSVDFESTDIAPRVDGAAYVLAVLSFTTTIVEDMDRAK